MIAKARALLDRPDVAAACRHILTTDRRTLARQVDLAQVAAPTFREGPRADLLMEMLSEAGVQRIERDAVGNVLGWIGAPDRSPFVLSAHLDTVFPPDTDLTVARRDGRLVGPGISDDARGLAALIAVAEAVVSAGLRTRHPILVAGTVGEEGAGDLRGGWHLFREGGPARGAVGFVSLDGAGLCRIVNRGLGARRLRATVHGSGGHSWVDRKAPNPIHALGTAVEAFARMSLPDEPAASVSVTRWGGGTSINAIPSSAWVELDIRSESAELLADTESRVREQLALAVRRMRAAAPESEAPLELKVDLVGNRPAGRTSDGSRLVEAAMAATRTLGWEPQLIASSTDANVPMHLGIDAITLGAGGQAGGAHTRGEWYANVGGPDGVVRALLTTLLVADTPEDRAQDDG